MQTIILSYLRIAVFIAGVLIGIQAPGFVDQYGKSLESHYIEAKYSVSEFQRDADRYFDGDMEKLISYYIKDPDPVFRDGGKSISTIYERFLMLEKAYRSFKESTLNAYMQTFLNPVSDIKKEVWRNYTYIIKLDSAAISIGLITGLALSALAELIMLGAGKVIFSSGASKQTSH